MNFTRITVDAHQIGGVSCIHHLRIPVATVAGMLADGMTETEILQACPDLEPADIREALRFAVEAVEERELPLITSRCGSWSTMPCLPRGRRKPSIIIFRRHSEHC